MSAASLKTVWGVTHTAESRQRQRQRQQQEQQQANHSASTGHSHYVLAVVPKALGIPFFDPVHDGCLDAAAKLSTTSSTTTVECLFVGPSVLDGHEQAKLVEALLNNTSTSTTSATTSASNSTYGPFPAIDGLAISVEDETLLTPLLKSASSIPIVTFDSDAPESGRSHYIGTNNSFLGMQLARAMETLVPDGGLFGVISGSAPNLRERADGILAELHHHSNWHHRWNAFKDSPFDAQSNVTLALQQLRTWATADETPVVLVSVFGLPMQIVNDTNTQQSSIPWKQFVDEVARDRNITLLCADDLPHQLELLQSDYVDGLVGQLPFDMGQQAIRVLYEQLLIVNDGSDNVSDDDYIIGTNVISHTHIPLELPEVQVNNNLIGNLQYVGYTLFAMVAITALGFGTWAFYRRKVRVVRVAQPRFLIMIAVGVLIMASCMIPLGMDDGGGAHADCFDGDVQLGERCTAICMSVPWLGSIGFTITFSALYSKTRRVNKIFHSNTAFGRVKVSERDVLVPFFVLLCLNVIILVAWTLIDPLTYIRVANYGRDGWNRVISTYGVCSSEKMEHFLIPLAIVNMGVLLLANWQAYEARDIESEFAETKCISICMASMLQAMVTGIPVLFVVGDLPNAYYIVLVLLVFVISVVILGAIFVPKIYFTYKYLRMSPSDQKRVLTDIIRKTAKSTSGPRFSAGTTATGPSSPFGRQQGSTYTTITPPQQPTYQANNGNDDDATNNNDSPADDDPNARPESTSESNASDESGMVFFRKSTPGFPPSSINYNAALQQGGHYPSSFTSSNSSSIHPKQRTSKVQFLQDQPQQQQQQPLPGSVGQTQKTRTSVHHDVIEEGDEDAAHEAELGVAEEAATLPMLSESAEFKSSCSEEDGYVTADSLAFVSELEAITIVEA
ncbi:acid type B receptor subunit 2 [Seminavis robusta]|uniref:Acid type B receptor subunit 2 n=1 Tax=Seminavis robusta TaxID=568900 RepID=A0A9N8EB42_9STRA|nr:acid type B receptor subunit 2 [Seminavis robusta]|eukprot:Sro887_g216300.1 acid type B receptor subunit 2 (903) ;mRNA; f:23563-26271